MIYLAGPFFKPKQLALIKRIEAELDRREFTYVSPRRNGVLNEQNLAPEERATMARSIFEGNISDIQSANAMIAIIDDRDPGTMWEMGYAAGMDLEPIISYTDADYDLNLMLAGSITAHAKGMDQLGQILDRMDHRTGDLQGSLTAFRPGMDRTW